MKVQMREQERAFATTQGVRLRRNIQRTSSIIGSYISGARRQNLDLLRNVRNGRLAHRRTAAKTGIWDANEVSQQDVGRVVERLYRSTLWLVRLLNNLSLDVDYNPNNTGRIRGKDAERFWDAVRPEIRKRWPDE